MKRRCVPCVSAVAVVASLLLVGPAGGASWSGAPGPLDGSHLVVMRGTEFRDAADASSAPARTLPGSAGQALEVQTPRSARFSVRHAGKYTLWIRSAAPPKLKAPLKVTLADGSATLLETVIQDGPGKPGVGGPAGYEAYAKLASQTGAEGKVDKVIGGAGEKRKGVVDGDDLEKELLADLDARKGLKRPRSWIDASRLEEQKSDPAFYWWNAGAVELKPGACSLRLAPAASSGKPGAALVDLAFLTTSTELVYPWVGDVDAPKASYIRFRIDELPDAGATISAAMRVHFEPWSVGPAWLNPSKLSVAKSEPHTQTGYTRWYRLQDIEKAPAFGAAEGHLSLTIRPAKAGQLEPRGATQFAVFPHADFVLREISWNEPEGTNLSLWTDFETYLHKLRTLRDHAREDYDRALAATGGRVFPLTRGPLYFGNAWGAAGGGALDYMAKTLRLLGFNSVGQANEPVEYRKLYGWTSHAGQYWPPVHMPFDEAASVKAYDDYYREFFSREREFYEGVSIFQIADEPGEISRAEMTAPFWRFLKDPKSESDGKWVDAAGDSELSTRQTDLANCVLEGKVEQHGTWIGFRVATDRPSKPTRYAYWNLGAVSQNREFNVAAGKETGKPGAPGFVTRPAAVIGRTPTEFKIVYDGNSAALFVRNKLVHQHTDLPEKGGLGIVGPPKAITELRLRPIRKDERLASASPDAIASKERKKEDLLDDLEDLAGDTKKLPAWARPKPLEQFVREDWTFGGGMPEAHVAFRNWAKAQGLTPDLFGQKSWNDVRMLTVPELVDSPADARLFYWSRRYSGYLTPRMFSLSADAIQKHAPNADMKGFVALSGHALYFPSAMPLDMFQLAEGSPAMMPGVSDWMSYGSWRWDSHQAVAYSVAMYNAGARRYGKEPASFPMMHCVWPSDFRAYTMLANQVKYVSFYNFGPSYAVTEGHWNDADGCYAAVHNTANRAAQVDDILSTAAARPGKVAMLYSIANEYWNPQSSFADKRALFLGLSHEYYQPELVTEDQIAAGALQHYDALFVVDPIVAAAAQAKIGDWVKDGGLLLACADAARKDEFNEPRDLLRGLTELDRKFAPESKEPTAAAAATWPGPRLSAKPGKAAFRTHAVTTAGMPASLRVGDGATIRAEYDDGRPGWVESAAGRGRVVYFAHRLGLTYTAHALRRGGYPTVWADTGRAPFVTPLLERKVERELILSHPLVMAAPLSNANGTVVILYNMQPQTLTNVAVTLKEPASPASVECFQASTLKPAEFEFAEGRLTVVLPELDGGQMLVVRRKPANPDDRLEDLRKRTTAQLASDEWRALSAGAFFAGGHPQWELTGRVVPLLKHERWEVRRSAAEALGRLGDRSAAAPLSAAAEVESDSHVLADEVAALARIGGAVDLIRRRKLASHPDALVRRQALLAVAATLPSTAAADGEPVPDAVRSLARDVAQSGLRDPDLRVRSAAITLLAALDPQEAARQAAAAFGASTADVLAQPVWGEAIATAPKAFEAWLAADCPGGDSLVRLVGSHTAHPELAQRLARQISTLSNENSAAFLPAVLRQRDAALARALFTARESLPATLAGYVPLILEHTFHVRLGEPLTDWSDFLSSPAVSGR